MQQLDRTMTVMVTLLAVAGGCEGEQDGSDPGGQSEGEGEAEHQVPICWQGFEIHQPCGNCGLSWSVCGSDGQWGPYGDCEDEGPCAPGTTAHRACFHCGTQTKTCTAECVWTAWSECFDEGECWPGQERTSPCGDCGTSTETCSDRCRWPGSECTGDALSDLCEDGDDYTQDRCEVDGTCEHWDLTECPLGSVCCGPDTSACGEEPVCANWRCNAGACELRYEGDGSDPENECEGDCCDGHGACGSPGDHECCGNDASTCGEEPVCADLRCNGGACVLTYDAEGTDPEAECGQDCCDGQGSCAECPGCPNVECAGVCCDEGERCCLGGCRRICGGQ